MAKKHYVITAAVSEDGQRLVLLQKQKGPEHLIGKLTFPGGHIDAGDPSAAHAACRELGEETGVALPLEAFVHVGRDENDTRIIEAFLAFGDISAARTVEGEPVHTVSIDGTLSLSERLRAKYVDDFFPRLEALLPHIHARREAYASTQPQQSCYLMPYERPDYQASIDRSRPHELLDEDLRGPTKLPPNKRWYLKYRYTDTGECVVVPNMSYNVTPAMKVASMRFDAQEKDRKAQNLLSSVPQDWTRWMAEQVAERLRGNAVKIRAVADGIESGQMPLDTPWDLVSEDTPARSSEPGYTPPLRRPRP